MNFTGISWAREGVQNKKSSGGGGRVWIFSGTAHLKEMGGGVTMYFSEIIKLQFRKNCHTLLYILAPCKNIVASTSLPIAVAKVCFSRTVINRTKILLY